MQSRNVCLAPQKLPPRPATSRSIRDLCVVQGECVLRCTLIQMLNVRTSHLAYRSLDSYTAEKL
jgi:hypothetical protein